ncbi:MAG TPA: hypothetical protein ENN38_03970 [Actinobacteria bacterium]|nr:hypothetical protein [Actinomycetota bacterium]
MSECPNLEKCPFFKNLSLASTAEVLKNNYCRDNFENCARKKIKDSGEPVPENLWPNGKMG